MRIFGTTTIGGEVMAYVGGDGRRRLVRVSEIKFDDLDQTPNLHVYRMLRKADPNVFWRMGCGHHENLLDEALDEIASLSNQIEEMWE